MKKRIITALAVSAMLINPLSVKADNPATLMKDVNFDGIVNGVDASYILSTYALKSIGKEYPTKTVLFGILCNGQEMTYKSFTIEGAEQYIDSIKDSYPEGALSITADITVYNGEDVRTVIYHVRDRFN